MRKASLERDLEHYSNPDNWKTTDDVLHHQVLKEAYYNEFPEEAAKREAAIRAKEPVSDLPDYKPMEPPKSPIKLPERNPKIPPRFYPSKWIDEDGVRDIDLNKYKAYKETLEQDPFSKLKRLLKGK